jgi:uncharacterized protein YbjT (DUF2867 family)
MALPLRTLLLSLLMVAALTWLVMPALSLICRGRLTSNYDSGEHMIVITTPTGTIGKQVLENLLDSDESLRVIVRDPSRLSPKARERVEVIEGSHDDADVVNAGFADADAVFWLCPPNPTAASVHDAYVGFSRPACDAFRTNGVKRVVGISALGRGTPMAKDAGFVTASLAMDDLIASSGVGYRAR